MQFHKSKKSFKRGESALTARPSPPLRDPELAELFANDPGALAIVDAIAATQHLPRARQISRRRLTLVAVVAAVAFALVAAFARDSSRAGVIQRAIAALPGNRVLRLSLEDERAAVLVVNLPTGERRAKHHTIEEWFDPRTGTRRVRDLLGKVVVSDAISHSKRSDTEVRGVDQFPAVYRDALTGVGRANVKRSSIGSTPVYEIRFPHSRVLASVAVDAETFRPVRVVFHDGSSTRAFRIVRLTALAAQAKIPSRRRLQGVVRIASVIRSQKLRVARIDIAPRRVLGMRLVAAKVLSFPEGGHAFDLIYGTGAVSGRLPARYLRVQLANLPYAHLGWRDELLPLASNGKLVAESAGGAWSGYLRHGNQFVHVMTSEGLGSLVNATKELDGT